MTHPTPTDTERAEFEAMLPAHASTALGEDGQYRDWFTRGAWFWRTARSTPAASGWQLVPVDPTPEMMDAVEALTDDWPRTTWEKAWAAMLAAAPLPPAPQAKDSHEHER